MKYILILLSLFSIICTIFAYSGSSILSKLFYKLSESTVSKVGGPKMHTPELNDQTKGLLNTGLRAMKEQRNDLNFGEVQEMEVHEYTTQVVAGKLSKILAEIKTTKGNFLVYFELLDQPWLGIVNEVLKGCVLPEPVESMCLLSKTSDDCKDLIMRDGICIKTMGNLEI